jgi:asparagine synthase (glutamine-hydrolysing)
MTFLFEQGKSGKYQWSVLYDKCKGENMCRLSVIKGPLSQDNKLLNLIGELQKSGATLAPEFFVRDDVAIILNRFDITSSKFEHGAFPLENQDYVFAFNGEIYSYKDKLFNESNAPTDAHFAFEHINRDGHDAFFKNADYEGTFVLYQKKDKQVFVYTDPFNSKGCFYGQAGGSFIAAQELSIIDSAYKHLKQPDQAYVSALHRGYKLQISDNIAIADKMGNKIQSFWSGAANTSKKQSVSLLLNAIKESVRRRIPPQGEFGVLCSGGVDSSLILKCTVDALLESGESLDRLKIFTMSSQRNDLEAESDDLKNARLLVDELNRTYYSSLKLDIIDHAPALNEFLFNEGVFGENPFLITPNPVQTQVRHTVMMATTLAQIGVKHPDMRVILTGDFADEIFAGYNSMHTGDLNELVQRINKKIDHLQVNDAARVTLSSLHGCKYLMEHMQKTDASITPRPMEIRTPFISPLIAKAINQIPAKLLVGGTAEKLHSKYILRLAAEQVGLPASIAWRKKIPFNEGGTGIKNGEMDVTEETLSKEFLTRTATDMDVYMDTLNESLMQKIGSRQEDTQGQSFYFEEAVYKQASKAGLRRIVGLYSRENNTMPDSNYSTSGELSQIYKYRPGGWNPYDLGL